MQTCSTYHWNKITPCQCFAEKRFSSVICLNKMKKAIVSAHSSTTTVQLGTEKAMPLYHCDDSVMI